MIAHLLKVMNGKVAFVTECAYAPSIRIHHISGKYWSELSWALCIELKPSGHNTGRTKIGQCDRQNLNHFRFSSGPGVLAYQHGGLKGHCCPLEGAAGIQAPIDLGGQA